MYLNLYIKRFYTRAQTEHVQSFTLMNVRVEGQSAVLDVEGKRVDVKVAGADDSERFGVVHLPGVVQVQVRDLWGCIFIHTAKHRVSIHV